MGAINSCCIPSKNEFESEESTTRTSRNEKSHRRNLSATFNMSVLEGEDEPMVIHMMDINTATEEELMTLSGINRETAKQVIDYRKQIHGFKRIEDLALVSGVGATKLGKIQREIFVRQDSIPGNDSQRDSPASIKKKDISSGVKLISLNSSNVFQLMKVKGVGQTLAETIVTFRDKKGPFTDVDQLIKVKGIGPKLLSAIKPQVTLSDIAAPDSVSYSSSRKSANINSALPSRKSDISLNSENHSSQSNDFSKGSLENLLGVLGPLSEKPTRPEVDLPNFKYNNRNALRIASWNLERFSVEKASNPGVRDVVCMTILENGLSIVAVQELADQEALHKICNEMNNPTLPNNQKWCGHRGHWNCCVSPSTGRMYMSSEYNGYLYDESQGVKLISSCLMEKSKKQKQPFTRRPFIATFKMKRFDCVLVSVHLKATGLANEDLARLQQEIDRIPNLIDALQEQIPDEKDIIMMGDFNMSPGSEDFDCLRKHSYHNCIEQGVFTNISNRNIKGSKTYDNIWISEQTKKVYTGHADVVREGLSSPWIPSGWTWGGVVSDHCPIWMQVYTGRDLDSGDITLGPEDLRFTMGND